MDSLLSLQKGYDLLSQGSTGEALAVFEEIRAKGLEELAGVSPTNSFEKTYVHVQSTFRLRWAKGYAEQLMYAGKIEEAEAAVKDLPPGLLEADAVIGAHEQDKLLRANLDALEVWTVYVDEKEAIQHRAADSTKGMVCSLLEGDWDGTELHSRVAAEARRDRVLVERVREQIVAGEADTIAEALEQLGEKPKGDFPVALIHFTSSNHPERRRGETLLRLAYLVETREGGRGMALAAYELVASLSGEEDLRAQARNEADQLQNGDGFFRSMGKVGYSYGTVELAFDTLSGVTAFRTARLAQRAVQGALQGKKAVWAGRAALVATAGTGNFVGTTTKESFVGNPEEVLSASHLTASYKLHLGMTGGMMGAAGLGAFGGRWTAQVFGFGGMVGGTMLANPQLSLEAALGQSLPNYFIYSRADRLAEMPLFSRGPMPQAPQIRSRSATLAERLFSRDFDVFGNYRGRWRSMAGAVLDGPGGSRDGATIPFDGNGEAVLGNPGRFSETRPDIEVSHPRIGARQVLFRNNPAFLMVERLNRSDSAWVWHKNENAWRRLGPNETYYAQDGDLLAFGEILDGDLSNKMVEPELAVAVEVAQGASPGNWKLKSLRDKQAEAILGAVPEGDGKALYEAIQVAHDRAQGEGGEAARQTLARFLENTPEAVPVLVEQARKGDRLAISLLAGREVVRRGAGELRERVDETARIAMMNTLIPSRFPMRLGENTYYGTITLDANGNIVADDLFPPTFSGRGRVAFDNLGEGQVPVVFSEQGPDGVTFLHYDVPAGLNARQEAALIGLMNSPENLAGRDAVLARNPYIVQAALHRGEGNVMGGIFWGGRLSLVLRDDGRYELLSPAALLSDPGGRHFVVDDGAGGDMILRPLTAGKPIAVLDVSYRRPELRPGSHGRLSYRVVEGTLPSKVKEILDWTKNVVETTADLF